YENVKVDKALGGEAVSNRSGGRGEDIVMNFIQLQELLCGDQEEKLEICSLQSKGSTLLSIEEKTGWRGIEQG
ncbi:putative endonuclease 4, partial [Dissostichus eleginoides]